MLKDLHIKNYALIDTIQLSFDEGLTIITGETGAGKSILLGGLELVRGKRAQQGLLKNISQKSVVETSFCINNYQLNKFFEQNDLDFEKETIIRRELLPNGKSRAFVNDTPVRLEILNLLTENLIDIHSQHQTLELNNKNLQFNLLDAVADNYELINDYKLDYQKYNKLNLTMNDLSEKLKNANNELAYKQFQ
jgi:DNA repair protein RecN (Recombination protein N)